MENLGPGPGPGRLWETVEALGDRVVAEEDFARGAGAEEKRREESALVAEVARTLDASATAREKAAATKSAQEITCKTMGCRCHPRTYPFC